MGSNGCEDVMVSGSNEVKCSEATVEIKIKTLDSQTYTMRVDKCVPVPALKEQIATVTGILSEQQRLICRGKVLKDDQLLSAYHVEDGHTLHLVVRQQISPSSESFLDHPATDPVLGTGRGQGDHGGSSVVVGTFNIPGQGDGILPDFSQIISAVLGSFGVTNIGSGSEGGDLQEPASERLSRTLGLGSLSNSSRQQPDQAASNGQSNPYNGALPLPTAVSLESLQPLVIPDSLTTLSQYLSRLRQEFSDNVRGQSNNSVAADTRGSGEQDSDAASRSAARRGGLPTPASLAEVMLCTRQILNEQVGEFLSQLTRQLEDHANLTNLVARMRIQSNALRSGVLLQNLGAFLLELGRTTMTLRMAQTPADAVVNAGPAVFISSSGPTPIMVQPLPFQPGTSFGAVPAGTVQPAPGSSDGTVRSGFLPRSIDIRIHTGSLMSSAVVNQREPIGGLPLGRTDPATSGSENSIRQAAAGATGNLSSTRAVPTRTVVAAVPPPVGRPVSNSSRGSVGLFYPLLARVEPVTSGNLNSRRGQASDEDQPHGVDSWRQPIFDSVVHQQNVDIPQVEGSWMQHGQSISSQMIHRELDQLLRTIPLGDINFQGIGTNSANSAEAAPIVDDEGTFLSNLLRQIIPVVSQNTTGLNNSAGEVAETIEDRNTLVSTQPQLDRNRGTSSRRRGSPPSPSSSKRQKRE